jgi:S-formylglutathione hydrolase
LAAFKAYYQHPSTVIGLPMRFSVYQPPQAKDHAVPVLFFLAGLTCTEETFMIKAGAQRYAAELGLMLVTMDTSPRQTGIPGETDAWDFGAGAGFYLDATASAVVEALPHGKLHHAGIAQHHHRTIPC